MDERRKPVIEKMAKILCKQTKQCQRDRLGDRGVTDDTKVDKAVLVKAL